MFKVLFIVEAKGKIPEIKMSYYFKTISNILVYMAQKDKLALYLNYYHK